MRGSGSCRRGSPAPTFLFTHYELRIRLFIVFYLDLRYT